MRIREWKDLTRAEKRIAWMRLWEPGIQGLKYKRLCDCKTALGNFLRGWCFDEAANAIFPFNSLIV